MSFREFCEKFPAGQGCYQCFREDKPRRHDHRGCANYATWRTQRESEARGRPSTGRSVAVARLALIDAWEKGAKALKAHLPKFEAAIAAAKAQPPGTSAPQGPASH